MFLAYHLLGSGFAQQGAFEHLHWFKSGQVQLIDPNEVGSRGSLLASWLAHGDVALSRFSLDKDPAAYAPDRGIEALALWLLEQGANPWLEGEEPSLTVWKKALAQGHCDLMRALARHPLAPSKQELEAVLLADSWQHVAVAPPVWFAKTNQVESLLAWAELGFDVNLGVGTGGPGARAISPEFLQAWGKVGGQLDALEFGKPLPQTWSGFPAEKKIKMERVWQKYQPARKLSADEAIDEFLLAVDAPFFARQALSQVRFLLQSLKLKWSTQASDGQTLLEKVQDRFFSNPKILSASLARSLFRDGDPDLYLKAVVAGVGVQEPPTSAASFPSSLSSVLTDRVLGEPAEAWAILAAQWIDAPVPLLRLMKASYQVEKDEDRDFSTLLGNWVLANPEVNGKAVAEMLSSTTHMHADFVATALASSQPLSGSPLQPWFALYVETRTLSAVLSSQPERTAEHLGAAMSNLGAKGLQSEEGGGDLMSALFDAIRRGLVSDAPQSEAWKSQVQGLARHTFLNVSLPAPAARLPKPRF